MVPRTLKHKSKVKVKVKVAIPTSLAVTCTSYSQGSQVRIMADKPPVAAAVQPTIPRRRNRRRQQSEGNRRHSIWQASDAHASGSASAEPAWPDQSVREGWAAASAADVDGWTVTAEDRDKLLEKSLWTLDRCLSSSPSSIEQVDLLPNLQQNFLSSGATQ